MIRASMNLSLILIVLIGRSLVSGQEAPLKGIDVFGTNQITAEQVQQRFGDDLKSLVHAIAVHDEQRFGDLYSKVTRDIQAMGSFASVSISPVTYFDKGKYCYVTIDIVDEKDRQRRMTFLPAPNGRFKDPDGLLAAWREYEESVFALMDKGELTTQKVRCPAFHCIGGFDHPRLKKYEEILKSKVPKNKETLKAILRDDEQEAHRADAAFLLAHISDPQELIDTLLPSIKDSRAIVRNNVMRVLSQVAEERRDVAIPIGPLLQALDFPATTDRNKSLATIDGLASRPENKKLLIRDAGPKLIEILKLLQPNNHDFAYLILKKISGKDFGERNYGAWVQWLHSQ
jgi:hypothetical protein